MKFDIFKFITNSYTLIFLTLSTGMLLGKVKIGKFKLGISGSLFTGLFLGLGSFKTSKKNSRGSFRL